MLEKTPWFWAQYFGLLKTDYPLAHPNAASKMRVAWLERLRLALNYFVGRSTYNMTLLPVSSSALLSQECTILSDDLEHLRIALSAVFVASGGYSAVPNDEPHDPATFPSSLNSSHSSLPRHTPQSSIDGPSSSTATTSKDGAHSKLKVPSHHNAQHSPTPHSRIDNLKASSFSASTRRSHVSHSHAYGVTSAKLAVVARGQVETLDAQFGPQAPPVDDLLSMYRSMDREDQHLRAADAHAMDDDEHWRTNSGHTAILSSPSPYSPHGISHSSLDAPATRKGNDDVTRSHSASSVAHHHDVNRSYHSSIKPTPSTSTDSTTPVKHTDTIEEPAYIDSRAEDGKSEPLEEEDPGKWLKEGQKRMEVEIAKTKEILELCRDRICQNEKDPFYQRGWLKVTVMVAIGGFGAYKLAKNWRWLIGETKSTKVALINFFKEHAIEPIKSIWRTIRYDSDTAGVMSQENLEAEVKSLVRMVHQWNSESPAGLLALTQGSSAVAAAEAAAKYSTDIESMERHVRNGVMPGVMEAWEAQLPHPIHNALLGDLLRLALIQVQKQKVDLEKAMAQLDRILQQNAINLQIMAALPAILAFLATSSIVYSYFSGRDAYRGVHKKLRQLLHRAGMLINASSSFYETDLPPSIETPGSQDQAAVLHEQRQYQLQPSSFLPDIVEEDDDDDEAELSGDNEPQLPHFDRRQPNNGGQHHRQHSKAVTRSSNPPLHSSSLLAIMRAEHFGELQCVLSQLLDAASTLPTSERVSFIADLRELAKPQYSSRQRLTTISRMYFNYPFLNAADRS